MTDQSPKEIEGGKVLSILNVDDSMEFTGRLNLYAGDNSVEKVPHVAIVEDPESNDMLVIHCDKNWGTVGIQSWNAPGGRRVSSVKQAQEIVEKYYSNSIDSWSDAD